MNDHNNLDSQLIINIAEQTLTVYQQQREMAKYSVSTAKNGLGSQENSGCTPLGQHIIAKKIGEDAPIYSVFVGRVATGEIYSTALDALYPERDWILSRILWLSGLETGSNKGSNAQGNCDTYQRYIYIHGTPDTEPMGIPLSHGCVRMHSEDVINLFEQVEEGMAVTILAE